MWRIALALISLVAFITVACGMPIEAPAQFPALANAPAFQEIPTYDGSRQATHPDIAYFPDGWHGYKYWMAMTPYTYDSAEIGRAHV